MHLLCATHTSAPLGAFSAQKPTRPRGEEAPLTEFINYLVLESQLPHKIVNLLITMTNKTHKL